MPSVPAGVIIAWPGTAATIPSGWTRVSTLDDRYVKGAAAGVEPDATGGAATHTHTSPAHAHSIGGHAHNTNTTAASGDNRTFADGADSIATDTHTHASVTSTSSSGASGGTAATWATASNDPSHFTVIWIQSDGTAGLPAGALALWTTSTPPTGWAAHAASEDRYFKGAQAGADGGASAGSSHSHAADSHVHTANHQHTATTGGPSLTTSSDTPGGEGSSATHTHGITLPGTGNLPAQTSASTGTTTNSPPYRALRVIENTSGGAALPEGLIACWLGALASIPNGWVLCDGTNGTPDMREKYLIGASAAILELSLGGALGHDHTDPSGHSHASHVHAYTSGAPDSTQVVGNTFTQKSAAYKTHTHTGTSSVGGPTVSAVQTVDAAADSQPPFRTVAFISFQDTLNLTVDAPLEAGTVTAPAFTVDWSYTRASDGAVPTQNDYRVRIYDNAAGTGTTIYDSGATASATTQHDVPSSSGLANNTTYYIKVDVTDVDGLTGVNSPLRSINTSWAPPSTVTGLVLTPVGGS